MNNNSQKKINNIDFSQLLEFLKRKDINSYSSQELELLTELFKNSGYNINFLKLKESKK
jgi:hypothetical protein